MKCEFCGKRAEAYINGRLACGECIVDFSVACLRANALVGIAVRGEPKYVLFPEKVNK